MAIGSMAGAATNAMVNLFNGKKNQKASEESRAIVQRQQDSQQKLAEARIMMEHVHHQESLATQQRQREADRDHQANLSQQNREAQAREGALAQHQIFTRLRFPESVEMG
jgi:hypothetical protein